MEAPRNTVATRVFTGTVADVERRIEHHLDLLRQTDDTTPPAEALRLLSSLREAFCPVSLRATVQLEEEGRKKRSTADASNWNHERGEIVLFYEPVPDAAQPVKVIDTEPLLPSLEGAKLPTRDLEIQQLCEALDRSEKDGKHFVPLKRFRDLTLPAYPFPWTSEPENRQRVLTSAIETGAVLTAKIPNPKLPSFPTTTLTVNRGAKQKNNTSRFSPIDVLGEPVSATILRDRG